MTFLYTNSADTSKIGFLNQAVGNFTFDIFKKANELFSIRALKPSTVDEEMEIIFDAPANTIKTNYNSLEKGLKLDFVNSFYAIGENYGANGSINLDYINNEITIYDSSIYIGNIGGNNTRIQLLDGNKTITTISGGDDIGLKLDFQNTQYYIGDYNFVNNQTYFYINDNNQYAEVAAQNWRFKFDGANQVFKTSDYLGNDTGLKLDFALNRFYLGDFQGLLSNVYFFADNDNAFALIISNGYTNFQGDGPFTQIGDCAATQNSTTFGVNDSSQTLSGSGNLRSASAGGNSGQHLKIRLGGTDYKIQLLNP